ncbi:polysaccharide lyase [Aureimonas sp. Leaf454]|uniref:polysaccharide lyase n=1 Tax=Aureimonas sp. Leaf454 TaxID=1736381 RepID=UPI001FCE0C03|nr:polysaccharide lyase [Aureimonas sp. Leaf454]
MTLDFEGGTLEGWSTRRLAGPHSARVQSEVVRGGGHSCRFELRPGDHVSQGLRAELRDWYNPPFDTDVWYAFSTYLPKAEFAPPEGTGIVLAQWHDQARLGDPSGKPPFALRYRDGLFRFTGAFGDVASPEPDRLHLFHERPALYDAWLDFTFRLRWSRRGDTRLEAWLNGDKLFAYDGPLGYRNEDKAPYFKIGVYASGPIEAPLVVYHDEYRRGATSLAVVPAHPAPAKAEMA